jgi:hypothetical protein
LRSPELEFSKSLWGLGTEEEEGYRTGPRGYIGWRNSFLGIDSGAPYTFKTTGSVHVVPPLYGMYSQTLRYTNVDKQRFSLCASRVSRHCTLSGSLDCIIADPPRFLNLVHCGSEGEGGEESHLRTPQSQKIPFNARMMTELRQWTLTSRVLSFM